jgi:hypothetical protein
MNAARHYGGHAMIVRSLAVASWVISCASVVLLAYVGYTSWKDSRMPPVRVEVADLVLDNATAGINTIEYVVVNDGSEPIQLLGGDGHCVAGCCFGPNLEKMPAMLPTGRTAVAYEINVRELGEPFSAESTLFLLWRGRMVPLKVSITGTASSGSAVKQVGRR